MVAAVHLLLAALLGLGIWSYSSIVRALETANLATKKADAEKLRSQRMSAGLALDRGLNDSQQGQIASGLLWMAESLAIAPPEDTAFAGVAEQNLAAWRAPLTIQRIMAGHGAIIEGVSLSPDGRTFASSGRDGAARRWDAATGEPIGEPLRHSAPGTRIGAVAFDPTGRWIATGSDDQTSRIWDAKTGEPVGDPVRHPDAVNALAFTPDGEALLVGTGVRTFPVPSSARLVEVASGRFLTPPLPHGGSIRSVAVTPDGRTLITGAVQDRPVLGRRDRRPARRTAPDAGRCHGAGDQPRREEARRRVQQRRGPDLFAPGSPAGRAGPPSSTRGVRRRLPPRRRDPGDRLHG